MSTPNNQPAFPTTKPLEGWGDPNQGMSLRDWFAGQALEPVIRLAADRRLETPAWDGETSGQVIAREVYAIADALLAEREKSK